VTRSVAGEVERSAVSAIYDSRIRGRQTVRETMLPHLPLLMRSDAHLASRHRAAQQHIPRDLIFRKVCIRMVVFNLAFQQSSCAGKTTPLMADRGSTTPFAAALPQMRSSSPQSKTWRPSGVSKATRWTRRPVISASMREKENSFMGYRSGGSCCTAPHPARRGGNVPKVSTSHPAHEPAAR
jgi:hypothetical protein